MVKPYLNQVGGKVETDVSMFTGGLNTYVDKAFLEADQLPYVMNLVMKQPPAIETRNSRTTIATFFEGAVLPWTGQDIITTWAYNQDLIYFLTKVGDEDYDVCVVKRESPYFSYTVLASLNETTLGTQLDDLQFCYGRQEASEFLYIGNEGYKARIELGSTNPLVYTEYTDNHYGYPCWHKSRLWLLKPSEGKIEWSNALKPDDFTIGYTQDPPVAGDSGENPITSARGKLTGLVSFDDKLMVFSEHSTHAIYGTSGIFGDQNYFQVVDILGTIGCLSQNHIALSGSRLYWFGDDKHVYEYSGASINIVSRPGKTRNSTLSLGGIDRVISTKNVTKLAANTDKLYVDTAEGYMFVFDSYNRAWWCEDGGFSALSNYSHDIDNLMMATHEGDLLTYDFWLTNTGRDDVYDFEQGKIVSKDVEFEFHTRVYGADGADSRKTLSNVWLQMYCPTGAGEVFINDVWANNDVWFDSKEVVEKTYKKIGDFATNGSRGTLETYDPHTYEQKHFPVEKMFGQRLNTFQIVVKGRLIAKFYLMKREWRIS